MNEFLVKWNPHWYGGGVSPLILKHNTPRAAAKHITARLVSAHEEWRLIPGPRQIGKTTTLGHVMKTLLEQGVPRTNVVFIPVDNEEILRASQGSLSRLIKSALAMGSANPSHPTYLFLDEIQELPRWDSMLKSAWDEYHLQLRVVATGSSILELGAPADFLGRIQVISMHPLKFREAIANSPKLLEVISEAWWTDFQEELQSRRSNLIVEPNLRDFFSWIHSKIRSKPQLESFLQNQFEEYCVWGGLPAISIGSRLNAAEKLEFLESTFNNIIVKDLKKSNLKKLPEFRSLFRLLVKSNSSPLNYSKLASSLGIDTGTVRGWVGLLQDLQLIQLSLPRTHTARFSAKQPKVHLQDPGWHAWVGGPISTPELSLAPTTFGLILEGVIIDHLRRFSYNISGRRLESGFMVDPEIDFVTNLGRGWLAVEIKASGVKSNLGEVALPDVTKMLVHHEGQFLNDDILVIPSWELALAS